MSEVQSESLAEQKKVASYRKRLLVFVTVAVLLAILFFLGNGIRANQRSYNLGGIATYLEQGRDILRIELDTNESIELRMDADIWTIHGDTILRARLERVEDLLDALNRTTFIRRVSSSTDDLMSFGLDKASTLSLFDDQDRLLSRLYFGNVADLRSEQYFRIEGSNEIYTINTDIAFYLDQSSVYWTDLRLWKEGDYDPILFYREYPDRREQWQKGADDDWVSATDEELPEGLSVALSSFLRLEGESIVDSIPSDAQYLLRAGFETDSGDSAIVMIYSLLTSNENTGTELPGENEEKIQYYVSQSGELALLSPQGESQFYILPEWRYQAAIGF